MAGMGKTPYIWPGPEGSCRRWSSKSKPTELPCPKKCFEPNDGPCCDYKLIVPQPEEANRKSTQLRNTIRATVQQPEQTTNEPPAKVPPTEPTTGQVSKIAEETGSTSQAPEYPNNEAPTTTPQSDPPPNQLELDYEGPVRHLIDVHAECCRKIQYESKTNEVECQQTNPCSTKCRPLQTFLQSKELSKYPRQKPTYKNAVTLDADTMVGRVFPMKFRIRRICNKCNDCGNDLYLRNSITDNNNLLLISNCCSVEVYPQQKVDNMNKVPVATITGTRQRFTKKVIEEMSQFRLFALPKPKISYLPTEQTKDDKRISKGKPKKGKKGKKGKKKK